MKIIKPKFWDKKRPNFFSYLLLPFTLLLTVNNFFRNYSPKLKTKKIKTICVGNIYLGGTGKTPTVIKLFEILKTFNEKVAIAKKFYTSQIDEITLLKKKTSLIIGNKRTEIIRDALKKKNNVLIFDDGLQDKNIDYDLKIVCFDALNWVGIGLLFPAGPLREKIDSLKKFDAVLLKNLTNPDFKFDALIKKINPSIKIFNSIYKIKNFKDFDLSKKYLIFSGIGNPNSFKKILINNHFKIFDENIYPDHYKYNDNDISNIINKANNLNLDIITTEKDFVKIPNKFHNKIKFLSIDLEFYEEEKLINFLKSKIYE